MSITFSPHITAALGSDENTAKGCGYFLLQDSYLFTTALIASFNHRAPKNLSAPVHPREPGS